MVLVYEPVLDPTKGAEYCQVNVTASLGREFTNPSTGEIQYHRDILPVPLPGGGSQLEKDLVEHAWKWSPVKLYERPIKVMPVLPNETGWRLSVDLLLRHELEAQRSSVRQPFYLAITVADPDHSAPVYQEMQQQLAALGIVPISLRGRVRARYRGRAGGRDEGANGFRD